MGMAGGERPDLRELRRKLAILVGIIVVVLIALITTTLYLYARYSAGVRVTP